MSGKKITEINQPESNPAETEKGTENTPAETGKGNNLVLALKRPLMFEGKEIKEIDLNGLERLTGKDMRKIDKMFRSTGGASVYSKEVDSTYLQLVAMEATGFPQEFFDQLHAKDVTALEIKVRNFLII